MRSILMTKKQAGLQILAELADDIENEVP